MSNNAVAIIVTYNRKELLYENIKMLINQSQKIDILIVDNASVDKTYEFMEEKGVLTDGVHYLKLNDNVGGAGGFVAGLKFAVEKGYECYILMDDDGRPVNSDTIEILLNKYNELKHKHECIILNSLVACNDKDLSFGLENIDTIQTAKSKAVDDIIYGDINPFNGTLINIGTVKKIGMPNDQLFIRGDEVDYMLRARAANVFLATVVKSLYYHPAPTRCYADLLSKHLEITNEAIWKEYYIIRNQIYLFKKHNTFIHGWRSTLKFMIVRIINVFYYNNNKHTKSELFKITLRAFKDGITGNLGKNITP